MLRRRRQALGLVVLSALIASWTVAATAAADDGTNAAQPSRWPAGPGAAPRIEATANSVRFLGPDRYQTNLATVLALRGKGGFPFTTPDRSSSGATSLASSDAWWGDHTCPHAVIIVAGDNFADALAAASLSNPSDQPGGPLLERVAAADPLFDPVGGFARVDTAFAPIIVTLSGRDGATTLTVASRIAAQDMALGGCNTARDAIIVGGVKAIPRSVEPDLLSAGYTSVYRVAGVDRFDTAARVAQALGTAPPPDGATCADADVTDGSAHMGFEGRSVVELHTSPTQCNLLGRTVVLADGGTGADALAAGWWTSFWQVPVLLSAPDGSLPPATRAALQVMAVNNLVVLGGSGRITDAAVAEAQRLTSAAVTRVAGADRYETSVEMAKRFGGWWPTGHANDSAASIVCLAASGGQGGDSVGWPDALGAGPWCGAANGAAANALAPARGLVPVAGGAPAVAPTPPRPARDAAPVLLVSPGQAALPAAVATFLAAVFPAGSWCTSAAAVASCVPPGFVVAFGGPSVIDPAALASAASEADGGSAVGVAADVSPAAAGAFFTTLDMTPVFGVDGDGGANFACYGRSALSGVRWVAGYGDAAATQFDAAHDVMLKGRYATDADGTARTPGVSAPVCLAFGGTTQPVEYLQGVSVAGRVTAVQTLSYAPNQRITLSADVAQIAPVGSGAASETTTPGTGTTWTFTNQVRSAPTLQFKGATPSPVTAAMLTVTATRGTAESPPNTVAGVVVLTTPSGTINATVDGEALFDGSTWRIRGELHFTGGSLGASAGVGGFRADITVNGPGSGDDTVTWRLDGIA